MPELPEVEHVVRALRRAVLGQRIVAVDVNLPRLVVGVSAATFKRKLRGLRIEAVNRRGKYILIELDQDRVLLVHLRMTGKFVRLAYDQKLPPYAHVVFYLDDDSVLAFCDMRQFGRMKIVIASRLQRSRELKDLAPEPLSDDFSLAYLSETLARSRRPLKQLLLDQTKILGLGNTYAAEALLLARISPFASATSLSKQRIARLHKAIQQILSEAIESGSTLKIDLADGNGSYFGGDERFWRVYEREGEPCVQCGTRIRRVVQAARSTYYCPKCQRR